MHSREPNDAAIQIDIDPALRDYFGGGRGPIPAQRMYVNLKTYRTTPQSPRDMEHAWEVDIDIDSIYSRPSETFIRSRYRSSRPAGTPMARSAGS